MSGTDPEAFEQSDFRSVAGSLLISVPDLADDNFDRTVLFIIEHERSGAMGLVLNRPTETHVVEHLPILADAVLSPDVFFLGGPVAVGSLMVLGRRSLDAEPTDVVPLHGPIVLVDPKALMDQESGNSPTAPQQPPIGGVEALRLFTGYSGWAPGQLEVELASGVWYVADAMTDDVLCADPANLWRSVMRRQGGRLASQALYPEDIRLN